MDYERDGAEIYRRSFATIRAEADLSGLPDDLSRVVVRMIHACGMVDAIDDLRLMAACRHHIIANSSLSWWGAWLAQHQGQVVAAPCPWVPGAPAHLDLLPTHWIKLPRV